MEGTPVDYKSMVVGLQLEEGKVLAIPGGFDVFALHTAVGAVVDSHVVPAVLLGSQLQAAGNVGGLESLESFVSSEAVVRLPGALGRRDTATRGLLVAPDCRLEGAPPDEGLVQTRMPQRCDA